MGAGAAQHAPLALQPQTYPIPYRLIVQCTISTQDRQLNGLAICGVRQSGGKLLWRRPTGALLEPFHQFLEHGDSSSPALSFSRYHHRFCSSQSSFRFLSPPIPLRGGSACLITFLSLFLLCSRPLPLTSQVFTFALNAPTPC